MYIYLSNLSIEKLLDEGNFDKLKNLYNNFLLRVIQTQTNNYLVDSILFLKKEELIQ